MSTKLITTPGPASTRFPYSLEFHFRQGDGVEIEITAEISYRRAPAVEWCVSDIVSVVAYASAQGCPIDWTEDRKGWTRTVIEWAEADIERIMRAIDARQDRDREEDLATAAEMKWGGDR